MPTVQQVKKAMRKFMAERKMTIANTNDASGVWGAGARRNCWRITTLWAKYHKGCKASTKKAAVIAILRRKGYLPPAPKPHKIITHKLSFRGLVPLPYHPGISWHHSAGWSETVESIHVAHQKQGWSGIGYAFVIYPDGSIHKGRGLLYKGAHSGTTYGNTFVGVCIVGNFETGKPTDKQVEAARWLHDYLHAKKTVGKLNKRHRDFVATACPGKNFPFAKITG